MRPSLLAVSAAPGACTEAVWPFSLAGIFPIVTENGLRHAVPHDAELDHCARLHHGKLVSERGDAGDRLTVELNDDAAMFEVGLFRRAVGRYLGDEHALRVGELERFASSGVISWIMAPM